MEDGQEQEMKNLVKLFQPSEGQTTPDKDGQITAQLESTFQVSPPIECFLPGEII
jgi:hypothetical protein